MAADRNHATDRPATCPAARGTDSASGGWLAAGVGLGLPGGALGCGVLRSSLQRWLAASRRERRLERLLEGRPAWACLVLLPRFALLVVAGDLVAAALRGSLSPV